MTDPAREAFEAYRKSVRWASVMRNALDSVDVAADAHNHGYHARDAEVEFARELLERAVLQGGCDVWDESQLRDWCCDWKDLKNGYPVEVIRAHSDHAQCGHRSQAPPGTPLVLDYAAKLAHAERERDEAKVGASNHAADAEQARRDRDEARAEAERLSNNIKVMQGGTKERFRIRAEKAQEDADRYRTEAERVGAEAERLRAREKEAVSAVPSWCDGPGVVGAILHLVETVERLREERDALRDRVACMVPADPAEYEGSMANEKARARASGYAEGLEAAASLDLLEFVNGATRVRSEARDNPRATLDVAVPVACAAVELYRNAIRALAAAPLTENKSD